MPHLLVRLSLLPTLVLALVACSASTATEATDEPAATAPASAQPVPSPARFEGGLVGDATVGPSADAAAARPAPALLDLVNPDGSAFDLADHAGAPTLLFFGYTHCPDVCPATIGELIGVFEEAPQVEAVFVSVDPERDTPEHLLEWTAYMPENFHAVTGDPGAIRRAADGYGVKYARVETTSTAGYTMSHTADVFLIDQDGRLRATYPFGTPATTMVADISRLEAG